jgi:hypothetical protein
MPAKGVARSVFCFVGSERELSPVFNAVLKLVELSDENADLTGLAYEFVDYRRRDWPDLHAPRDRTKRSVFFVVLPSPLDDRLLECIFDPKMNEHETRSALAAE